MDLAGYVDDGGEMMGLSGDGDALYLSISAPQQQTVLCVDMQSGQVLSQR